mgnify:FL=1
MNWASKIEIVTQGLGLPDRDARHCVLCLDITFWGDCRSIAPQLKSCGMQFNHERTEWHGSRKLDGDNIDEAIVNAVQEFVDAGLSDGTVMISAGAGGGYRVPAYQAMAAVRAMAIIYRHQRGQVPTVADVLAVMRGLNISQTAALQALGCEE